MFSDIAVGECLVLSVYPQLFCRMEFSSPRGDVIGSGPTSLACRASLALNGNSVLCCSSHSHWAPSRSGQTLFLICIQCVRKEFFFREPAGRRRRCWRASLSLCLRRRSGWARCAGSRAACTRPGMPFLTPALVATRAPSRLSANCRQQAASSGQRHAALLLSHTLFPSSSSISDGWTQMDRLARSAPKRRYSKTTGTCSGAPGSSMQAHGCQGFRLILLAAVSKAIRPICHFAYAPAIH